MCVERWSDNMVESKKVPYRIAHRVNYISVAPPSASFCTPGNSSPEASCAQEPLKRSHSGSALQLFVLKNTDLFDHSRLFVCKIGTSVCAYKARVSVHFDITPHSKCRPLDDCSGASAWLDGVIIQCRVTGRQCGWRTAHFRVKFNHLLKTSAPFICLFSDYFKQPLI